MYIKYKRIGCYKIVQKALDEKVPTHSRHWSVKRCQTRLHGCVSSPLTVTIQMCPSSFVRSAVDCRTFTPLLSIASTRALHSSFLVRIQASCYVYSFFPFFKFNEGKSSEVLHKNQLKFHYYYNYNWSCSYAFTSSRFAIFVE